MQKKNKKLLIEEKGRVFIDVAYRGCGSGCRYCYVPSASEKQETASYEDLTRIVEYLNEKYRQKETIISFCPNTEPFKTKDSTDRLLFILRRLHNSPFHIQISTKECISDAVLYKLNELAEKKEIFINISMPYLDSAEIEPGAAEIGQRISNIERIKLRPHLKCGLYIKPCTRNAVDNVERYITIINKAQPDYVCIGVTFDNKADTPCVSLHHEENAAKLISAQKDLVLEFAGEIKSAVQCPVIYSSICAVIQTNRCTCPLDLWRYDEILCSSCSVFLDQEGNRNASE